MEKDIEKEKNKIKISLKKKLYVILNLKITLI